MRQFIVSFIGSNPAATSSAPIGVVLKLPVIHLAALDWAICNSLCIHLICFQCGKYGHHREHCLLKDEVKGTSEKEAASEEKAEEKQNEGESYTSEIPKAAIPTDVEDVAKMTAIVSEEGANRALDERKALLRRHDFRDFFSAWVDALKEAEHYVSVRATPASCSNSLIQKKDWARVVVSGTRPCRLIR